MDQTPGQLELARRQGALQIGASCAPDRAQELVRRTVQACAKVQQEGVSADELEKPPCGMPPVATIRNPRKPSRPMHRWTRAPSAPSRSVRNEAMALPTSAKGRRMLLDTHSDAGGSGMARLRRCSSSSSLK